MSGRERFANHCNRSLPRPGSHRGSFTVPPEGLGTAIWARLKLSVRSKQLDHTIAGAKITLAWADTLGIIRELGSKAEQSSLNFRFRPEGEAVERLRSFAQQIRAAREQQRKPTEVLSPAEIADRLRGLGFARKLLDFQLRDLSHLLSLSHGANFSVPGAGKTTVTFALHLLTRQMEEGRHFLVVAPKAAFGAWEKVVGECLAADASDSAKEPFTRLVGSEAENLEALRSGATRFIISYDLAVRQGSVVALHLATNPTHLVLDESHRMKAGLHSQRGAFLLRIAADAIRRDILTGTPMPQGASDMASQLDFLWPGHGYGLEISYGKPPRQVLGNLYVRTTKKELGLPAPKRQFVDVQMDPGQLALYSMVRNELVQSLSGKVSHGVSGSQFRQARRSVMRLLQLSINPALALNAMSADGVRVDNAIAEEIMDVGHPAKMREVMDLARGLASVGKKSVILDDLHRHDSRFRFRDSRLEPGLHPRRRCPGFAR